MTTAKANAAMPITQGGALSLCELLAPAKRGFKAYFMIDIAKMCRRGLRFTPVEGFLELLPNKRASRAG